MTLTLLKPYAMITSPIHVQCTAALDVILRCTSYVIFTQIFVKVDIIYNRFPGFKTHLKLKTNLYSAIKSKDSEVLSVCHYEPFRSSCHRSYLKDSNFY